MILKVFIAGAGIRWNPETFQQSIDYLFEPENLFTVCALLLIRRSIRSALRRLALLRRDDSAWPECLRKLDTFPAHFEVQLELHPSTGPQAISEFRAYVEGGCVGVYGIDMSDSQTPRRDHDASCRPEKFAFENQVMAESALDASWYQRGRCEV